MPAMETMPAKVKRNEAIAQKSIAGKTYREIAESTGVSKATVCRVLSRAEIKDIVDYGMQEMIARVPKAIDTIDKAINNYKENDKLAYKASEFVLKTATIAPSNVENQTINNIVNVENNIGVNPKVLQALGENFSNEDDDIIEAEIDGI